MPRALSEVLNELREIVTGDYTLETLSNDLKSQWSELYQLIFNAGHKKATAQGGQDIREVERKLTEAQETIETQKKQIKKLEDKAPEAATLRQEYETREANLRKELQGKIDELQGKVVSGYRMTRAQRLARELASDENLLHPEYAADVSETKYSDRFIEDERGQPIVLQLGQKIPYAAATEDEAIKLLAKDIAKSAPTWAKRSGVERGGGNRGTDGPAGSPNGGQPLQDARTRKIQSGDYAL